MDMEGKEMIELRPLHVNGGGGPTTITSSAPPAPSSFAASYLHHSPQAPQQIQQQNTHCQTPPLHPHQLPHAHEHFNYLLMRTHGSDADDLSMACTGKKYDDSLGQSNGKENHACANDASTCANTVHNLHQSNNADARLMKPYPSYSSMHIANPTFPPNTDMGAAAAAMDIAMHQQQQTHGILASSSLSAASTTTPPQPSSTPEMSYAAGDTPLPDPFKKKKARARKGSVDGDCAVFTLGPSSAAVSTATKTGYRYRARGKTGVLDQGLRPHIITIARGEDVALRIASFQQEDNWEICVLSALGSISNVTLRHSETSGGTITYEGCYDILSLSGSLSPIGKESCQNRGGLIVSLAGLDGQVIGGEVTGIFVAASPIKVVVGTYISEALASQMQRQNISQAGGTAAGSPSCTTVPVPQTSTLDCRLGGVGGDSQQYQCPSHIVTSHFIDTDGPRNIVGALTM